MFPLLGLRFWNKSAVLSHEVRNSWDLDRLICKTMGIDPDKIPVVNNIGYGTHSRIEPDHPLVCSNSAEIDAKLIDEIDYTHYEHVMMPSGWKNYDVQ